MKDGFFFIIESIAHFESLPECDQPFVIGRSMGTLSSIKCSPLPIAGVPFSNLPGQSKHVVGLSKSLVVHSAYYILKKCVLVARPSDISSHPHSYTVTALPNTVESD